MHMQTHVNDSGPGACDEREQAGLEDGGEDDDGQGIRDIVEGAVQLTRAQPHIHPRMPREKRSSTYAFDPPFFWETSNIPCDLLRKKLNIGELVCTSCAEAFDIYIDSICRFIGALFHRTYDVPE